MVVLVGYTLRRGRLMAELTICACCGQRLQSNTPDQEAEAQEEFRRLYGMGPANGENSSIVCDLCFQRFYAWMLAGPASKREVA